MLDGERNSHNSSPGYRSDGASVCSEPETEGGGQQEAGMTPEFSRTRDSKNGATRTLREMAVGDPGRVRANHRGVG